MLCWFLFDRLLACGPGLVSLWINNTSQLLSLFNWALGIPYTLSKLISCLFFSGRVVLVSWPAPVIKSLINFHLDKCGCVMMVVAEDLLTDAQRLPCASFMGPRVLIVWPRFSINSDSIWLGRQIVIFVLSPFVGLATYECL